MFLWAKIVSGGQYGFLQVNMRNEESCIPLMLKAEVHGLHHRLDLWPWRGGICKAPREFVGWHFLPHSIQRRYGQAMVPPQKVQILAIIGLT